MSRNITDIMEFTKGAELAWIDYVVEDVEQDVKRAPRVRPF